MSQMIKPGDMSRPRVSITPNTMLYHATFAKLVPNIRKNGLLVGKRPLWKDVCVNNKSTRTYFALGVENAIEFCEVAQDEEGFPESLIDTPIVVLCIKVGSLVYLDNKYGRQGFVCDDGMIDGGEESGTLGYRYNIPVESVGILDKYNNVHALQYVTRLNKHFYLG